MVITNFQNSKPMENKGNNNILEKRTINSILNKLREMVETRKPITAEEYIDAAFFLNILKNEENEELLKLEVIAKKKRLELRKSHKNATDATIEYETMKEYENYQRQRMRIEDIKEFIRISKKQGEIRHI